MTRHGGRTAVMAPCSREDDELPEAVLELWAPSLEKLGFVPNVLRLFALRPSHLLAWNAHYEELMKGPSGVTKAEREMIAVVVSVANDCAYCIAAHSAALRKLTKDAALADAIAADHTSAPSTCEPGRCCRTRSSSPSPRRR